MSLSHQKNLPIEKSTLTSLSKKLFICPECGQRSMQRVRGKCVLEDGKVVPKLEREHCFSCGADFFDLPAMKTIREFRQSTKHEKRGAIVTQKVEF